MTKNNIFIPLVLCALMSFPLFTGSPGVLAQDTLPLFIDAPVQKNVEGSREPTIVQERMVKVNFALLAEPDISPDGKVIGEKKLVLNLFNDVVVTAVIHRVIHNNTGSVSWIGTLEGYELSEAIIVIKDQLLVANISFDNWLYQVRRIEGTTHVIKEIDQSKFPSELDPVPMEPPAMPDVEKDATEETPFEPPMMPDDGGSIKVMVLYTDDARAAEGGTANMEASIDLAITETNTGYANSSIAQRVTLVHTEEFAYDESGFNWSTTLSRLQSFSDGYLDNAHSLRDAYEADEVVLIVNDAGYCGLGYMMSSVDPTFAAYSFALVSRLCTTGNYSLAHEMGHNMGARHDWYVDADTTPYSYSHGYINRIDSWRTIMAYNDECDCSNETVPCPALGSRSTPYTPICTRLNYWSNPNLTYGGDPMGVAQGTSTACTAGDLSHPTCDADNHLVLDNTALTVANFRTDGSGSSDTLTEGFEEFSSGYNLEARGWRYINVNADSYSWYIKNSTTEARTGFQYARMPSVSSADDWMFSKALNLRVGNTYRVTFYARKFSTPTEVLTLAIGTLPKPSNMTNLNQWSVTNTSWTVFQQEFTASSDGIHYLGWRSSANPSYAVGIDDITVTVISSILNISKAGSSGDGTVNSVPGGISCGADCSEDYAYNTTVTLSATPSPGSVFHGWSGEGCSGTADCEVTVTQTGTVSAIFRDPDIRILLVDDDDNSPDVQTFYTDALDSLGYAYQVWDTSNSDNEPDTNQLSQFPFVIWFTGDNDSGSAGPSVESEVYLSNYLEMGGRLFISSQDYINNRGNTSFMDSYLGLDSYSLDAGHTEVTGEGSYFSGLGFYSLSYPSTNQSDRISPDATSELAFSGDNGDAAIATDGDIYRTVFFGYPFEALPTADDRKDVMKTIVQFLAVDTRFCDFNGDMVSDIPVWRPGTGIWFILASAPPGTYSATLWGSTEDIPVPGDYDGDGITDIAVWRPSTGIWYILPSASPGTYLATLWGSTEDIPVPGDYDRDGIADIAVWRPSTGIWFILPSASPGTYSTTLWGWPEDIPVPSDYDGDSKIDIAVWRPGTGTWYILPSASPGTYLATVWGWMDDTPVPSDYDGDSKIDIAVWRSGTGTWYILPSADPGTYSATLWGSTDDIPIPGDYDGDSKIDIAVWRAGTGTWYILPSNSPGSYRAIPWGAASDVPISPLTGVLNSIP